MKRFLRRSILSTFAALAAAVLAGTPPTVDAQASSPGAGSPARPRVCLVLSGGGARGAAHVGVIAVLEQLRVPVDCIAGTSMGALVGGAYASGMSVAEMEGVLKEISTSLLFVEKPPREEQSIRAKLDDNLDLFGFELGVRGGKLLLPKGAVTGVQLETVLRRLAKVKGYRRFDQLPIPFRAVATDLVTGKAKVFSEGELATAMRASMSVPGVIAPAEIDGKMLVDGGLVDNLPVDVARRMGADVIIAVNLGTTLAPKEALDSVLGITAQVINLLTEQNVRASLAALTPADVLIEPALGDFSAADFDHLPQAVPVGAAAARDVADRLAALSLPPAAYAAWQARQRGTPDGDDLPIDRIRFARLERVNPEYALSLLETGTGRPIDQTTLDADLRRLQGTGDFEHVAYRVEDDEGARVLTITAEEKTVGPNYLRFGAGLATDFQGDTFISLIGSYRRTWVNALGGEWRTDVSIGQPSRLASEFYQPLDAQQRFFMAPRVELGQRTLDLFSGDQRVARYDLADAFVALDLGTAFTRYGEARVGLLFGTESVDLDTGPPELAPEPSRIKLGAATARIVFDQLDSTLFPRRGVAATANLYASRTALGADLDYTKWNANLTGAVSHGDHALVFTYFGGGRIGSGGIPVYDAFEWGGFLRQSGYPIGALLGRSLAFGRVVYDYRLLRQELLEGLHLGASLEAGRVGSPIVADQASGLIKSASVFVGADTPVGPLYLGYGRADSGFGSVYLYLGRP
jgi:NTE family protein